MSKAMTQVGDETLVRRARAGDNAAFAAFACRHWPAIGRFAWSMLGNAQQAIAVTEEVIGTVLQGPQEPEMPVARFMYRLALWLAIVRRRANGGTAAASSPVMQALDSLNRAERAAFLLRDVEELSAADAAAILEQPMAEVEAHLHHARLSLTNLLGEVATSIDVPWRVRRSA